MTPEPPRRITVDQYQQLTAMGVLTKDDRIELIDGWIVEKAVQSPRYACTMNICRGLFYELLPDGWYPRGFGSLVTPTSVPEPAVSIVKGEPGDYCVQHPTGADTALVVEVADTRLEFDREKSRIYAEAGVPFYWIVNLPDSVLEVYSLADIRSRKYTATTILIRSDDVVLTLPDDRSITLNVASMFP